MNNPKSLGEWAFLLGMGLAIILGVASSVVPESFRLPLLGFLGVLGLVVGFMNITEKEAINFLIASIALLAIPAALGSVTPFINAIPVIGLATSNALLGFVAMLSAFIAPACFVNAVKAIYGMAKDQ
ncbi:hypothetical protein HY990_04680 [Candidatus Micrarchaeota archaeon]|nr:hypothetical protein [Candidatus Micrarchaeota archaeon]